MPRFRNVSDFDTENGRNRPHLSILEVAQNDSVDTIDIFIEPRMFVQINRVKNTGTDAKGMVTQGWQIVTNVDIVKTRDSAIMTQLK